MGSRTPIGWGTPLARDLPLGWALIRWGDPIGLEPAIGLGVTIGLGAPIGKAYPFGLGPNVLGRPH